MSVIFLLLSVLVLALVIKTYSWIRTVSWLVNQISYDHGLGEPKRLNRRQRRNRLAINSGALSSRIRRHQGRSKPPSEMMRMTERDENLLYSDWSPSIYETHSRMGTKYWENGRHLIGLIESDKFENRFNKTFNRGTDRSGWFTFYDEQMWTFCPLEVTVLRQTERIKICIIVLNVANAWIKDNAVWLANFLAEILSVCLMHQLEMVFVLYYSALSKQKARGRRLLCDEFWTKTWSLSDITWIISC